MFPLTVFTHTLCQPANPDQVVFSFFKAFRFFLSGTERGQEQQKCTRSGLGSEFITVESSLRLFLVFIFFYQLFFVSREYPRLPPHPSPHCVQRRCAVLYLLCSVVYPHSLTHTLNRLKSKYSEMDCKRSVLVQHVFFLFCRGMSLGLA